MRYEDSSHMGGFQASGPDARGDTDAIPAGSKAPATGNVITGEGTQTGPSGSDMATGAHITSIAGAGGEDSSFAGGKLGVSGEFGRLTIDAEGNYSYQAKANAPENSVDRFTYTLADSQGNTDTATLAVEIGKTPAVIKANAQQVVPGPDGVVLLPPGVELSDIHIVGRNLVIDLPDGGQMVIIDGAVFVPQLVLNGVEIPATNLAALLVGQEIAPAADNTPPQSSGGNFEVPVAPLDPGVPLGDLIPPTEYNYVPPEVKEVYDTIDEEPEVFVQPDGQPASVAAVDSVDEKGLPERNEGEPEGSGEEAAAGANGDTSEATTGNIIYDSPDGVDSITLNGVEIVSVGQVIAGTYGNITITSIAPGQIGYSYTLLDNTSGDSTHDDFSVVLTDSDGDVASATLTINIIDDVPTARPDTDVVPAGEYGPVTGNVITDADAGDTDDGDNGRDTVGADDASLTAVTGFGSTEAGEGGWVVQGQYGVLTINNDGSYSYVRNEGTPGGVSDVFNYTLTDGDGDTSSTTLTITINDSPPSIDVPVAGEDGTLVDEQGLPTRNEGEPAGSGEIADGNGADNDDTSETTSGTVNFTEGDGPATIRIDGVVVSSVGQTFAGDYGVLTITAITPTSVSYSYTLSDNTSGDDTSDSFAFSVTDQDGDVASGNLVIDIIDDVPTAANDTDLVPAGTYGPETGNVITGDGTTSGAAGADVVGADDATVSALASNNVPANSDSDPSGGYVVAGQYGTLTMQADGSYSYVRNEGTPGGVSDVFTYTITDGDGDPSSATLTISIADSPTTIDAPDQGEAGTIVDEKGLPTRNGGEPAGTGEIADGNGADNDDTSETTAGNITYSAPDGPATITIDGVAVTSVGQTFVGSYGVLTITSIAGGSIGYSYTLGDNTSGDATFDDFDIQITDQDGDTANDTLVINIIDDEPIAVNDTDSITSGGTTATGNVITDAAAGDAGDSDNGADTVGADNASISGLASNNVPANSDNNSAGGFVVVGQYGTITMQADGSYSYVRADGTPGTFQEVFTYTLTDGDGDSTTATLTINIQDAAPLLGTPAPAQLDDDTFTGGNPGGTGDVNPDTANLTGNLAGSGGDGDLDYAFTGINTLPAGFSVDPTSTATTLYIAQAGVGIVLTITLDLETGAYTVTQNLPMDHPAGLNENDLAFGIGVKVIDVDGDSAINTLTINVDDDTPLAFNDTDTVAAGTATGNVISGVGTTEGAANADKPGADGYDTITALSGSGGSDSNPSGGFTAPGTYGTLQMDAAGNYTYTRAADTPGGVSESFTYTYRDGDGDLASATLTISIPDATPLLGTPLAAQLDDDAMTNGIPGGTGDVNPDTANLTGNLAGSGGDGDLDYAFTGTNTLPAGFSASVNPAGTIMQISQAGVGVVMTITLNLETGAYTIVQNQAIDHPSLDGLAGDNTENDLAFGIGVKVIDVDGDSAVNTLTINVDDDTPQAIQPDAATLNNEVGASVTEDLDDDGEVITDFGADGPGLVQFANITNGMDSGYTSDDDTITYWLSNNGQTLQGRTNSTNGSDGELVFTVQINQASGDYTVTLSDTIDNGAGVTFDDLTSTKAGNVDVRAVGADDPDTAVDLLLTASVNGANATINTDSDSIGAGNQSMDQGETVRVDFVSNLQANAGLPSGFSYDSHVGTSSLVQAIPQVQGSQTETVAFRVYALNTTVTDSGSPDDTPVVGNPAFSDSTTIAITSVTIDGYAAGETPVTVALGPVGTWTTIAYGVSARLESDGSVTFTGVQQGDQYGIETGSDFNAFAVTSLPAGVGPVGGTSTTNSFDLGIFSIGSVDTGDPINLSYDLQITDGDGDTLALPGAIDITINPAGTTTLAAPLAAESFSMMAANDDYSSLYAGSDGQKYGGSNGFGNGNAFGNTGIVAGMVAASGLAAMSTAPIHSFADPSFNMMVQDSFQQFGVQVVGRESAMDGDLLASTSLTSQSASSFQSTQLSGSNGFNQPADHSQVLDNHMLGDVAAAFRPAGSGDQPVDLGQAAIAAAPAPAIAMASAEMLQALSLVGGAKQGGSVEKVLADALGHGAAPTVDHLLQAVGGHGNGSVPEVAQLASLQPGGVPAWDMAAHGAFASATDMMFKMDATVLHHDAVQPVVNG